MIKKLPTRACIKKKTAERTSTCEVSKLVGTTPIFFLWGARNFEKGGGHFFGFDGDDKGLTGACADFLDGTERWEGPYMKNVPKDPWGNDYWFDADWNNREDGWDYTAIGSCGPDGGGLNDYDDPDNIVKTISARFDNSLN